MTDPSGMNYTAIVDSYRYNFDYPSTPKAIVYPETVDQVAATVKCATEHGVKVQARSGGHSYGNYGEFSLASFLVGGGTNSVGSFLTDKKPSQTEN